MLTKYKSTCGFNGRFRKHKRLLRLGNHHSRYLQRSWDKYGEDSFSFIIIQECLPEDCVKLEQRYIDLLDPEYNMTTSASSCLGSKRTQETKDKISKANKGRVISREHREKISNSNLKINNPKRCDILKKAAKGRKMSEKGRISNRDKRRKSKSITSFSIEDVLDIRLRLSNKEKGVDIAKIYKTTSASISDIKHFRTFKDIKNELSLHI